MKQSDVHSVKGKIALLFWILIRMSQNLESVLLGRNLHLWEYIYFSYDFNSTKKNNCAHAWRVMYLYIRIGYRPNIYTLYIYSSWMHYWKQVHVWIKILLKMIHWFNLITVITGVLPAPVYNPHPKKWRNMFSKSVYNPHRCITRTLKIRTNVDFQWNYISILCSEKR